MNYNNIKMQLDSVIFFLRIGALTSKPFAFSARSWELENVESTDFFDSFGSQIYLCMRSNRVLRILPRITSNLNDEWISDKVRFSYDGWFCQRLVEPFYVFEKKKMKQVTWKHAFFYFFFRLNLSIFDWKEEGFFDGVFGKFIDMETGVAFRDFSRNVPQLVPRVFFSANSNVVNFERKEFYSFFQDFNFLLTKKNVVIFGCDLRLELPLLFLKLTETLKERKDFFLFFFGLNLNFFSSKSQIYNLGSSFIDLINFFYGKTKAARIVNRVPVSETVLLLGETFLERVDGLEITNFFQGNSLFPNIIFLKTRFSSLNFYELGLSVNKNMLLRFRVKNVLLYLLGNDEVYVKQKHYNFVVYQGSHGSEGVLSADLCLPGTTFLEKKSSSLSFSLKRIGNEFLMTPPGEARTDWRILTALSLLMRCNFVLPYGTLFELYVRLNQIAPGALVTCVSEQRLKSLTFLRTIFVLSNTVSFSTFGNYFNNDYFSRSSKTMGLAYQNYLSFFNNFK